MTQVWKLWIKPHVGAFQLCFIDSLYANAKNGSYLILPNYIHQHHHHHLLMFPMHVDKDSTTIFLCPPKIHPVSLNIKWESLLKTGKCYV
jgi:hypothetical protein